MNNLRRLVTLDPGHFHAALVQKSMVPGIAPRAHVYAPLGPDLLAHLQRIASFNTRAQQPTSWELEVHAGPNSLERLLADKSGDILMLAGRNDRKLDAIEAGIRAGLHVLADKPWILQPSDLARLEAILDEAERRGLIAYDIMTERYEITSLLQAELLQTPEILGAMEPGTLAEPSITIESVHYLKKTVAGAPLRRPAWFFDCLQQGEGLSDVGTHLVDLVAWMLFPGRPAAMTLQAAKRWPTVLSRAEFAAITGDADFPAFLLSQLEGGKLPYFCNTQVSYEIEGIHTKLDVLWDYEAPAGGGDTHLALFQGTNARIEIRQGAEQKFVPELYVVPRGDSAAVQSALARKIAELQARYPGVGMIDEGPRLRVTIPERYRVGHEAHFAEVTQQFLRYVRGEERLPAWEKPAMVAKYAVTTGGVEMARQ